MMSMRAKNWIRASTLAPALVLTLAGLGCSHAERTGRIDAVTKSNEARVFLDQTSGVQPGDQVTIYKTRDFCEWPQANNETPESCLRKKGTAQVTEILGDHYAMVQLSSPLGDVTRGDYIVRQ